MTSLRRALAGIGALAVVVGAAVVALILSGYYELRGVSVAFAVFGGFGFVGAGLYAWSRRPDRKIGALMTLTGFAWFAAMCCGVGQRGGVLDGGRDRQHLRGRADPPAAGVPRRRAAHPRRPDHGLAGLR